jgi:hypothetical protein
LGNAPVAASLVAAHPELKDGTLPVINLEHVDYSDSVRGQGRATDNFGVTWNTSVTESAKVAGVTNCGGRSRRIPAAGSAHDQLIQAGTFYPTSGDVYEQVPGEGMERAARFHAFMIEAADQAADPLLRGAPGSRGNPSCGSILIRM